MRIWYPIPVTCLATPTLLHEQFDILKLSRAIVTPEVTQYENGLFNELMKWTNHLTGLYDRYDRVIYELKAVRNNDLVIIEDLHLERGGEVTFPDIDHGTVDRMWEDVFRMAMF